jgi:hypothetical protein
MPLMVLKMVYCVKKVKVRAVTVVMSVMVVIKILGDSVANRNFIVLYHFFSKYL